MLHQRSHVTGGSPTQPGAALVGICRPLKNERLHSSHAISEGPGAHVVGLVCGSILDPRCVPLCRPQSGCMPAVTRSGACLLPGLVVPVAQVRVFSVKAAVDGTTFDRKGRPRVQGGRRRRSSSASAASGTDSTEEHKGATAEGDSDASPRSVAPEAAPQDVPVPETPDIDQAGSASFNDGSGSHTTAVRGACVECLLGVPAA